MADWNTPSVGLLLGFSLCMLSCQALRREQPTRVCGGNHVCRTLMQYKDGTVVDEGENCLCKEGISYCNKEWEQGSASSLTWQHYERAHWTVQYKFCTPVFANKNFCESNKTSAVIETDVNTWQPYISQPRCVCEGSRTVPKSMGWKKEGGLWKYSFSCNKEECASPFDQEGSSACLKIYVAPNRSTNKVLEMEFLCNCPDSFLCPAKYDDKEDKDDIVGDHTGSYVVKYCESIKKRDD